MDLYIRIENGQPVDHPLVKENILQAFPGIDLTSASSGFVPFERVRKPVLGVYQKNQRVEYELKSDGSYQDVWYCDEMTAEEIEQKQNQRKVDWANEENYPSWTFDADTCSFIPPVPRPLDGGVYSWNETNRTWDAV